ncbi:ethanolamine phosphatidyltransferase, putative [Babesia bigemina]|uniref:Ethanolamine phosphatidyltransferase, putative n=1 Tax=Babesia bigemina TaxID=5866 RepID=A0A061DA75_BABBI|nr:ethanolamine phosphatidyltransferase, putative [Babesia bigemina]CDR94645.1 ethanolamine phosphatidyltransferase, putative [Babesia bigemina]|eukprot:XP_012766831.1 ethanolamine phosphatidyltransferase, putative [Babesia bigemina]
MECLTRIIPKANLPNLKKYKFQSGATTCLDALINRFWWTPVAHMLPRFVSPNVVTLMGGFCIFVTNFCIFTYMHRLESSTAPTWMPLLASVMTLLYLTFDGIDGKQARKLGMSSPLGQLLDHGLDAVVTVFYPYICCTLYPGGFTFITLLLVAIAPIHVLCTVWRESEFETFEYTNGVLGVTEANLLAIALQAVHYYVRPHFGVKVATLFGGHPLFAFLGAYFPRVHELHNAMIYLILAVAYSEGMCGVLGLAYRTSYRLQYLAFMLSAFVHSYSAYYLVYTLPAQSRVAGCIFASMFVAAVCVNNIVCLLSKSPMRCVHWGLLPQYMLLLQYYGVGLLRDYGLVLEPAAFHRVLLAAAVYGTVYLVYVFVKTICEITEYLQIPVLTVPASVRRAKAE